MAKTAKKLSFFLVASITLMVILIIGGGFVLWASAAQGPDADALAALTTTGNVNVSSTPAWITFQPLDKPAKTGLIFYPGGKVEFRSYAPALKDIAAKGFLVVLPSMPLNLAFFKPDKAAEIIKSFPNVMHWVIGGHSLGGSMAALYAAAHPKEISGLVLWAAYPPSTESLRDTGIKVLMVFGTQDGLITRPKLEDAKLTLPVDTLWVPIEGGNHAQFGDYGAQDGDNPAIISAIEQQTRAVQATIEFLTSISK
jgi:dienelactone hydrolase